MKQKNFLTIDGNIERLVLGNNSSANKILIMAGKHGDEPEGVFLLQKYLLPFLKWESYFNKQFIIFPNLNPTQINSCMDKIIRHEAGSYDVIRNHRLNLNGINLNADFPTKNWNLEGGLPLQATQTKIVIDTVEKFKPSLILDFHTNGKSTTNIYKYDEPIGQRLAHEMGSISNVLARDYVHYLNKDIILSGTSGTYFGKERAIPILTIELGRSGPYTDFFEHCLELWDKHVPAFSYLFKQNL